MTALRRMSAIEVSSATALRRTLPATALEVAVAPLAGIARSDRLRLLSVDSVL